MSTKERIELRQDELAARMRGNLRRMVGASPEPGSTPAVVERHPFLSVGGATAVGVVVGNLLRSSSTQVGRAAALAAGGAARFLAPVFLTAVVDPRSHR